MTQVSAAATGSWGGLKEIRGILLRLHKLLLDRERAAFEKVHGQIQASHDLLKLVINDEQFAWLHALSELIVRIDETLDLKDEASDDSLRSLLAEIRALLKPSEEGIGFARKYFDAIQDDPETVLTHAQAVKLLETRGGAKPGT